MKKLKLIVSDFHLGAGRRLPNGDYNILEDFLHDHRFKEFLEHHTSGEYQDAEVELIFNGDMLNLIQVDYHGHFPVVITEAVSLHKVKSVIRGHAVFFDALRKFLSDPKHTLTYVVGNHDQEMLWKGTRAIFEAAVGGNVQWKNIYHLVDGIHIEHGHQFEAVNRMDPTRFFLTENVNEPILNLPWGTLFAIQWITKQKLRRSFIDKVRPFRMLIFFSFLHDAWMTVSSLCSLVTYFISTRFTKNRYRQSSLKTTFKILREASVFPELADAAKRILSTPEIHTVVFGHTHVYKHLQIGDSKQYLNTGTWTEVISLDLESFARKGKLTYVKVDYHPETNKAQPNLRHWIGQSLLEDDAMAL